MTPIQNARQLFTIAAAACALLAPVTAKTPAAKPFPQENSDIIADPAVRYGTLENGVRYALMKNAEPPKRISMRLHIDAGSLAEEEDQRGIAHFLEHMAFNGTKNFKPDELVTFLQSNGISFGAHLNAYTSLDETVYMLDLPDNRDELVEKGLLVLSDWADGMLLLEEQIDHERGVILSEKRDRDSIEFRLMEKQFTELLPETRMSKRMPIGLEEVIANADRQRFVDFYENNYSPDRTTVVIVGDFDIDVMEKRVRELFSTMKPLNATIPDPELGKVTQFDGIKVLVESDKELKSTDVDIVNINPFESTTDTVAQRGKDLPLAIANAMLNSRLSILAKEEDAQFTSARSSSYDLFDTATLSAMNVTAKGDDWESAMVVAENELRRALEYGFTQSEFDEVRANLQRSYEDNVKSKDTRRSDALAGALTKSLHKEMVFSTPEEALAIFNLAIANITPEAAHLALVEKWEDRNMAIIITSPKPIEGGKEAVLAAYQAAGKMEVDAPEETITKTFAYSEVGTPGKVVKRTEIEDLALTQLELSNGIRVNLKTTDFTKNSINLRASVAGGLVIQPDDKPGLSLIADSLFNAGGLVAHSTDELDRIFAGKRVGTGLSIGADAFNLAGTTAPEDLEIQLTLMCAYLQHAGYREEAGRMFQKMLPMATAQMKMTAEGIYGTKGANFLAGNDPRFGLADVDVLANYTMDDVKAWLSGPLKGGAVELSIVGDFDIETAIPLIEKTFGALPERPWSWGVNADAKKVPSPTENSRTFTYESQVKKGLVNVNWRYDAMRDITKIRTANLLGEVLSDRLRVEIREKEGDAYSPRAGFSDSNFWINDGGVTAVILVDPAKAEMLTQRLMEIGADLAENGVTKEELDRAREPIIAQIRQARRTNGYWLGTVLSDSQRSPEVLDWARTIETGYSAVTGDQVSALAKEILAKDKAIELIIKTTEGEETAKEAPKDSEDKSDQQAQKKDAA